MTTISDSDLHALIRTLLGVQATLVAASVAVLLYLIARWREVNERARTAQETPQTVEQKARISKQAANMVKRSLRAKVFVFLVPLITALEALSYFYQWPDKPTLVLGVLIFYIFEIMYLNWVAGPPSTRIKFEIILED